MSALYQLNASSLYSAGNDIYREQKLISNAQIQQGLSMQKQSLMRMYAPVVAKNTVICCCMLRIICHNYANNGTDIKR